MRHVVDLVLVQADRPDQVDLDLVAGGDAAYQVSAGGAACAGRPRVSAGCCPRGGSTRRRGTCRGSPARGPPRRSPRRPTLVTSESADRARRRWRRCRFGSRVVEGLRPGGDDRAAGERRGGDRRVVDDPVDDHLGHVVVDLDGVGGQFRELPGELPGSGQLLVAAVGPNQVLLQRVSSQATDDREPAAAPSAPRMAVRLRCRWTWVACAARPESPAAIASAMSWCSVAAARSRSGLCRASRRIRARWVRTVRKAPTR